MNIVHVSNEKYAPHLAASICSILENNRNEEDLHFYVISTGLEQDSTAKLKSMIESYADDCHVRRLIVLKLEDIAKKLKIGPEHGFLQKFDVSILGRFFLGELLPETMRKVIYLDGDTICSGSLREMYNEIPDANGAWLAGVMEPTIYKETLEMLGLTANDAYYNSGVMLIDMDHWHDNNVDYKLRNYYDSISKESVFADQDAINGLLHGQIKTLSPKYNFFSNYYYRTRDSLVKLSPAYACIGEAEFEDAKKNPVIIHFSGDERPWIHGNHNPYADLYYKYLDLTPWKGTPPITGQEAHMQAYHAMNLMTEIAPGVRDMISRKYGEKLHEERRNNSQS